MLRDISRLENKTFDLLIIGGGINGAAMAHLAAGAGASVALIEKDDWASGASSTSTKLLHGGIRYLEHFEFDLVIESLRERFIQLKSAPHLARPLAFVIPVYRGDARPLWMMTIGVWLYQMLSGPWNLGKHRGLSLDEIQQSAPGISRDGLVGGVEYFDAQMNDARMCLENVLMADKFGAVVANGVKAEEFIKIDGKAVGVKARDVMSGRVIEIRATKIIVAAGPWSDELIQKDHPGAPKRLRATKGAHVIYDGAPPSKGFLLQSRQDNRVFFMLPFQGRMLIGTTDTDYHGSLDDVVADEADVQYLLKEASRVFPSITFERSKIISSFAGLRPLVADAGHPSRISRKHAIDVSRDGVYFLMGGKYTTYRAIAEEVVKKILPQVARNVMSWRQFRLYGSGDEGVDVSSLAVRFGVQKETMDYLHGFYGSRVKDVLELTRKEASLKEKICSCSPVIAAQVVYARDVEMARNAEDVIKRRLGLAYVPCQGGACRQAVEMMMKRK
ncbi:MAG: glycerol-3-phosphate dehydrogenase/oxidase [Candidatus Omnitrophica bacterium]|nr:glycerol-3-phosphate dehydrogenase/oxidase [Candidatus Omnitrophota bacterium]